MNSATTAPVRLRVIFPLREINAESSWHLKSRASIHQNCTCAGVCRTESWPCCSSRSLGAFDTGAGLALNVPGAWGQVVESNQVDIVAAAVFRRFEQVLHTVETRFARQVVGDIRESNRLDRIDDNVPLVHSVTTTLFHLGPHPDADRASDPAASNALAKALGEDHPASPPAERQARLSRWNLLAPGSLRAGPPNPRRTSALTPRAGSRVLRLGSTL